MGGCRRGCDAQQGKPGYIKAELTVHLQVRWRERGLRRAPLPKHNQERSFGKYRTLSVEFQWMPGHIPTVTEGAAVAGGI